MVPLSCQYDTAQLRAVRRLLPGTKCGTLGFFSSGILTRRVLQHVEPTAEGIDKMAEPGNALKLDGIPQSVGEALQSLARQLRSVDGLRSITVVGSAVTEDFKPAASDINTVVVLERHSMAALNGIGALAKPMGKKRLSPPLLMTDAYIERSRDVFGMEFLDFQLTHRTILGDDPFAGLSFRKTDVRLQCERELKAILIRLRQGYIAAAGNRRLVRDVLVATAKGLAPLLRAMLWLKDLDRPQTMQPTFRQATGAFGVHLAAVVTAERWRYEKPRLDNRQIESAFESIYAAADRLATIVDALEV